jgi:16S rRNA (uracil1498-N3)-methyltransferase
MEIAEPATVERCLSQKPAGVAGLLADPEGSSAAAVVESIGGEAIALVGPEGGFTDRERAAAIAAGFTPVSLGPYILRVETAAVAIAATVAARPPRAAV